MIIKTTTFKEVCSKILSAIDNSEVSTLTETLELKTQGKKLYLNVTNKEYYASIIFNLDHEEEFHATVNAMLFLKLIAQTTAEFIELDLFDSYVGVKANGNYKIPLIFENDKLMELPVIKIDNVTTEMKIPGSTLDSIMRFNSKQLTRGTASKPIQKMYYVDQEGCITFTQGACVNSFTLEKPISVLLNQRLVQLFKLFKNNMVDFKLGYDAISGDILQTKVNFTTSDISLTAILSSDDTLLRSFPTMLIRKRATYSYPYSIVVNRDALAQAVNRLLLFSAGYGSKQNIKPYSKFSFDATSVSIWDSKEDNVEKINYANSTTLTDSYELLVDLEDFKMVLDGSVDEFVTIRFGDTDMKGKGIVIVKNNIANVIPQVVNKVISGTN